jgi:hypothetical protein
VGIRQIGQKLFALLSFAVYLEFLSHGNSAMAFCSIVALTN